MLISFHVAGLARHGVFVWGGPDLLGVLFHGTSGDALGELALEDDEEDDGRDDTQQRCGCQGGGFHRVLSLERGQGQRDGLHVVAHQKRHRDHVFVPCPDEEEHEQHTDSVPGDRQHHLEQHLPAGVAVDGCDLKDGLRERAIHGGEQVVPYALWMMVKMMMIASFVLYSPAALNMVYSG